MKLYDWQKECLTAWEKNNYHGIVNVVTGAGKTIFALSAMELLNTRLNGHLRIKIVVPVLPLVNGWSLAIHDHFPRLFSHDARPGIFTGERKDALNRKCMIYTINSARYNLARHILSDINNGFSVLIIADECHHYSSPENKKIFDFLRQPDFRPDKYFSLGLSATPQAAAGYHSVLVPSLGPEIYRYNFSDAVKAATVSPFCVYQIALSFSASELSEYDEISRKLILTRNTLYKEHPYLKKTDHADFFAQLKRIIQAEGEDSPAAAFLMLSYQRQRLTQNADSRISCAADLIASLPFAERILIFSEKISQAEQLYSLLCAQYPNQVGIYHSEMTQNIRKITLDNFRCGNLRMIVSCKALDEGVDVPDASVGIILSGTAVSRQRIQRLGRILRKSPQKKRACLYYLYIKESSEENAFLPDQEHPLTICNLSYNAHSHTFCHPFYEEAAAKLLSDFRAKKIDKNTEKELRTCIAEGLVRSDWLLPPSVFDQKIQHARSRHERNYWFCMKKLAPLTKSPSP